MDEIIKVNLPKVTHSIRAVQAVLQYGVGAMIDFPDQTLVTSAPEYWEEKRNIYDDRLAKLLGVKHFAVPTKISYSRFPEWYFCPKCRCFKPLEKWISLYHQRGRQQNIENDEYMVKKMRCPDCSQDLVAARIVTICEKGHLNDFPWEKWVHVKSRRSVCGKPELKIKTGASGSEGLEGINITCSCGAYANLSGVFNRDCFEELDEKNKLDIFRCEGHHPFKHVKEKCLCYPRTVQRGSSSVYFPVTYSSLVIPPYSDKLNSRIEESNMFADCLVIIEDEEPDERKNLISRKLPKWAEKISKEIGEGKEAIVKILKNKWMDSNSESNTNIAQYRMEEYEALTGEITSSSNTFNGEFIREEMDMLQYDIPHIKSIALINKVKVVKALIGFSRINPANDSNDNGFVCVKSHNTSWYPAYEVRGEGIFIEFNHDDIECWIRENPCVLERVKRLNDNYAASFIGKNHPREITPKFLMLHTLSHLLISQLSFECGYSIASLSERIYCSEEADGKRMAGIFIYTASGDSEGTMGGLVRQGRPDVFPNILKKAILASKTCSNDPVCIMSYGQGRDSLNLAACHACGLLPETCCEEHNAFLDRGVIIGTYDNPEIGFWSDI